MYWRGGEEEGHGDWTRERSVEDVPIGHMSGFRMRLDVASMDDAEHKRVLADLEERGEVVGYGFISLFPSLPFRFWIPIPFTRCSLEFGGRNLNAHRRAVHRRPMDADAHISLAALLLSQEPVTRECAFEAADELRTALSLLPTDPRSEEYDSQEHAMVHLFLGDALFELGGEAEARDHWQRAIELDPVQPPLGSSGQAVERLRKHPA